MSAPEVVAEDEDDSADDADPEPEPETEESVDSESSPDEDQEVDMVQTNVSESGADPEGFFDDVETDVGDATTGDGIFDDVDESDGSSGSDSDDSPEAADTRTRGLASDINHGASRLAVIGLDEEGIKDDGSTWTKDGLQDEFLDVFETARLGHYASITIEEYLLVDTEDIHPVWGLAGAMLICAAVVVFRRPDGDQLIDTTKTKLGQADLSNLTK